MGVSKLGAVAVAGVAFALLSPVSAPAAGCAPSIGACTVLGQPQPQGHGVLRFPQAIGFSPGGTQVFVGDQYSSVVQKFSIEPQVSGPDVARWQFDIGGHADRRQNGRLGMVGGIATDRSGHVYVLDSENDRVQVFSSATGSWLGAFGQRGAGEGQFDLGANTGAGGIAVWQAPSAAGANENPVVVLVADQRNHRVQRFTVSRDSGLPMPLAGTAATDGGKVVPRPDADWALGSFGDCHTTADCAAAAHDFHLNYPQGIAVNPADWSAGPGGRIYIADDRNHRVLIWRDSGSGTPRYAGQIGSHGTGQGKFRFPYDVGVDWHTPNHLYVADNNNHRVQQFDADAYGFLRMWGGFGPQEGKFEYPRALAALDENPKGGVYVADTANNRIQGFDVGGHKSVVPFGIAGRGPGYVTRPWGAAVDARGDVYIADTFDDRIQKLSADGAYLSQWGYISANSGFAAPGGGNGQFENPRGIAYDSARDRLWVADTSNNRVQELAPDGTWLATHTGFQFPYGVGADPSGDIYVADTANDRIRRWNGSAWSTVGTNPGFVSPRGVATAGDGVLYVADLGGGVWRFGGGTWSKLSGAPTNPGGVWVDRARKLLYVTDQDADRVMRLELAAGAATWESWGGNGTALGELIEPAGLTTDAAGTLLVADAYNNRIQRWQVPLPGAPADTTAPETAITAGPPATTKNTTPTFQFASPEAAARFECRMDQGTWSPCASPHRTATLSDGRHSFQVRAVDAAGNADATPAVHDFTVDTTTSTGPSASTTAPPSDEPAPTAAPGGEENAPLAPGSAAWLPAAAVPLPEPSGLQVRGARVAGGRLHGLALLNPRAGGHLRVTFEAAGRRIRFRVPVGSGQRRVRFRRRLPAAQGRLGTGILTVSHPGDDRIRAHSVRLRAAARPARLTAGRPRLVGGRLWARGTISRRARGKVHVRLSYLDGGRERVVEAAARIRRGRWSLRGLTVGALGARAAHAYITFTGDAARRIRGETRAIAVSH